MTITQLDRLIDEQNRTFNRMQEIQNRADTEGRDWTAEERTNWDEANARIDVVSADIDRLDKMAKLEKVDRSGVVDGGGQPTETAEDRDKAYDTAFRAFMRGGNDRLTSDQRQLMMSNASEIRDQGVTTPSAGGYLVPPGYRATMTEALKAYGGLINFANVITTTTGNPLQWPTNDDTGNTGAILGENTVVPGNADVVIGTKAIGAYTYTSKLVKVSLQLLQDSAFDLDSWLPRKLGQRIGRAVANHLVNGLGVGEPTGLLANATASGVTLTAANFTGTTSAAWLAIFDAIVDLEHSVDPAYRNTSPANDPLGNAGQCRFLISDKTLAVLRKVKDTQQRPLWLPVPTAGMPATINGQPYAIDQAMPSAYVATTRPILFGNFHEGYVVRQVLDVQAVRLAERYADFLQVGFFGFMRLDATPDDANAVKALVLS